jgi:DNA (cytosine-5)-methyltransferase 1
MSLFTRPIKTLRSTASAFSGGASGKPEGAAVNHFIPQIASTMQTTCNDYSRADGFNMVAFPAEMSGTQAASTPEVSPTLSVGHKTAVAEQSLQVRRLTPIECERLQGFPDNYTQIPWRNKAPEDCPDGPRYKAMGNSMAVPVMRWIGERIQMVEELTG